MKLFRPFICALAGIRDAFVEQRNVRIHFFALSAVCAAAWYFSVTAMEWCVLLLTCGLVIGLELINTSLETITDLVTKEQHPLARKTKDIAAGAVLIAAIMALIIGVIIFAKYV